uniref:YfbK domain-containing protein n=1 Tax=Flavobacterium subsaxonicum TaxID=426226 RepID=UPI000427E16C|nr:VWA domain-containing protein [Flavobacterium subsaxonicum]
MENQDKLYDQFKDAARKAETTDFARMEAVWNRVEDKLDNKKQRRIALWWKYTGIAALFLLFMGVGLFFLNNQDTPVVTPNAVPQNTVTTIDTQAVKETFSPEKETVKEEVVLEEAPKGAANSTRLSPEAVTSLLTADSISFNPTTKKLRVWHKISDKGEFTVFGEVTKNGEPVTTNQQPIVTTTLPVFTDSKGFAMVTGTVNDQTGLPIPGVTVTVHGTATGTQTDFDGKFSLVAKAGDKLSISYIGMKEQVVDIKPSNNNMTIAMMDDVQSLEEVVVVGYGTIKSSRAAERRAKKEERKAEKAAKANSAVVNVASAPAQSSDEVYFMKNARFTTSTKNPEYYFKAKKIKILPGLANDKTVATVPKSTDKDGISDNLDIEKEVASAPNQSFVQSLPGNVPPLSVTTGSGAPGSQALQGKAAGVAIIPNTGVQYDTLSGGRIFYRALPTVAIRGVTSIQTGNQPLYIIDGVPSNFAQLKNLKPENIKSVEMLKDAATNSVYGARGANGVIIIKTKKLTRKQKRELKKALKEDAQAGYTDSTTGKFVPMEKIKIDQEEYEAFDENKFENPATTPLSTFSIDVDNASYTNIRRFLNNGEVVPKDAVRVEEMINFFKYNYPQPTGSDPFSINTEYSDAPWNPNHKLLKIGLQGKDIQAAELPASNFVFLIDVSGSMSDSNKLPLLKESMKVLVKQMRKQDRIAIVVYAGAAGLVLPSTGGDEKDKIIAALDELESGGSTAGGAGIELAYKTALENFVKKGNNRVILATDGDFNVGASSNTDMQTLIEEKRKSGVFLTCLGYGMGNYKDSKLETLADKGNGNYAYIDNMQEADRYLNKEFKGSMYAIAKDVKIQIEFNPNYVQSYRLIGYENRKLRDEDFANDAIDAGELGSGHTVTALYEIIPTGVKSDYFNSTPQLKYSTPQSANGNYSNELATIKFRHKKPDEEVSKEIVKVIPNIALPFTSTSGDFKFSAAVAWFGLKLRDSKLVPNKSTEAIKELAKQGLQNDPEGYRAEFIRLVERVE